MNGKKLLAIITLTCFVFSFICSEPLQAIVELRAESVAAGQFKKPAGDFLIPQSCGRVTDFRSFGSRQVVVNIQDLHCHAEVQRNIAKILAALDKSRPLDRVYVEGGYGDIDTSWLCSMGDKSLRTAITENLLEQGRLSGGEYYSVTAGKPRLLKGLEDEALHKANVVRLGKILDRQEFFKKKIKELDKDLEFMQVRFMSPRNRKLNSLIARHKEGKVSSEKYYAVLDRYIRDMEEHPGRYNNILSITRADFPNINAFLQLNRLSKRLHYRQVSLQMQQLMQLLKNTLPYGEYTSLLSQTDHLSNLDELYLRIAELDRRYTLNVAARFPELGRFLSYAEKSRSVNPVQMLQEERQLVETLRSGFARTTGELDVSFLTDFYCCFRDYLQNSLSADDYEYFTRRFEKFRRVWGKYAFSNRIAELADDFPLLSEFYAVNCERNNRFLKNIALFDAARPGEEAATANALPDLKNAEIIVMVTGGFHTDGLKALLQERKISYVAITPNVTMDARRSGEIFARLAKDQAKIFSNAMALALASQLKSTKLVELVVEAANRKLAEAGAVGRDRLLQEIAEALGVKLESDNNGIAEFSNGARITLVEKKGALQVESVTPGNVAEKALEAALEAVGDLAKLNAAVGEALAGEPDTLINLAAKLAAEHYLFKNNALILEISRNQALKNKETINDIPVELLARFPGYLQQSNVKRELFKEGLQRRPDWLRIALAVDLLQDLLERKENWSEVGRSTGGSSTTGFGLPAGTAVRNITDATAGLAKLKRETEVLRSGYKNWHGVNEELLDYLHEEIEKLLISGENGGISAEEMERKRGEYVTLLTDIVHSQSWLSPTNSRSITRERGALQGFAYKAHYERDELRPEAVEEELNRRFKGRGAFLFKNMNILLYDLMLAFLQEEKATGFAVSEKIPEPVKHALSAMTGTGSNAAGVYFIDQSEAVPEKITTLRDRKNTVAIVVYVAGEEDIPEDLPGLLKGTDINLITVHESSAFVKPGGIMYPASLIVLRTPVNKTINSVFGSLQWARTKGGIIDSYTDWFLSFLFGLDLGKYLDNYTDPVREDVFTAATIAGQLKGLPEKYDRLGRMVDELNVAMAPAFLQRMKEVMKERIDLHLGTFGMELDDNSIKEYREAVAEYRTLLKHIAYLQRQAAVYHHDADGWQKVAEARLSEKVNRITRPVKGVQGKAYPQSSLVLTSGMASVNTILHHIIQNRPTEGEDVNILMGNNLYYEIEGLKQDIVNAAVAVTRVSEHTPQAILDQVRSGRYSALFMDPVFNAMVRSEFTAASPDRDDLPVADFKTIIKGLTEGTYDTPFYFVIDVSLFGPDFQLNEYLQGLAIPDNLHFILYGSLQKMYQNGLELSTGGYLTVISGNAKQHDRLFKGLYASRDRIGTAPDLFGYLSLDAVVDTEETETRTARMMSNAAEFAAFIDGLDWPEQHQVIHPSLASHPGHDTWVKNGSPGVPFVMLRMEKYVALERLMHVFEQYMKEAGLPVESRDSFGFSTLTYTSYFDRTKETVLRISLPPYDEPEMKLLMQVFAKTIDGIYGTHNGENIDRDRKAGVSAKGVEEQKKVHAGKTVIDTVMKLASPFNERIQKAANNLTHSVFNLFIVPLGMGTGLFTGRLFQYRWDLPVLRERRRVEQPVPSLTTQRRSIGERIDKIVRRPARFAAFIGIILANFIIITAPYAKNGEDVQSDTSDIIAEMEELGKEMQALLFLYDGWHEINKGLLEYARSEIKTDITEAKNDHISFDELRKKHLEYVELVTNIVHSQAWLSPTYDISLAHERGVLQGRGYNIPYERENMNPAVVQNHLKRRFKGYGALLFRNMNILLYDTVQAFLKENKDMHFHVSATIPEEVRRELSEIAGPGDREGGVYFVDQSEITDKERMKTLIQQQYRQEDVVAVVVYATRAMDVSDMAQQLQAAHIELYVLYEPLAFMELAGNPFPAALIVAQTPVTIDDQTDNVFHKLVKARTRGGNIDGYTNWFLAHYFGESLSRSLDRTPKVTNAVIEDQLSGIDEKYRILLKTLNGVYLKDAPLFLQKVKEFLSIRVMILDMVAAQKPDDSDLYREMVAEYRTLLKHTVYLQWQEALLHHNEAARKDEVKTRLVSRLERTNNAQGITYPQSTMVFSSGMAAVKTILHSIIRSRPAGRTAEILTGNNLYMEVEDLEADIANAPITVTRIREQEKDAIVRRIESGKYDALFLDPVANSTVRPIVALFGHEHLETEDVPVADFKDIVKGLTEGDYDKPFYFVIDVSLFGPDFQLNDYLQGLTIPKNLNFILYGSLQKMHQDGLELSAGGYMTVISRDATQQEFLTREILKSRDSLGTEPDLLSYLLLDAASADGSIEARTGRIMNNAADFAKFIAGELRTQHRVIHPSLVSHPDNKTWKKNGEPGVPFVFLRLDDQAALERFVDDFSKNMEVEGLPTQIRDSFGFSTLTLAYYRPNTEAVTLRISIPPYNEAEMEKLEQAFSKTYNDIYGSVGNEERTEKLGALRGIVKETGLEDPVKLFHRLQETGGLEEFLGTMSAGLFGISVDAVKPASLNTPPVMDESLTVNGEMSEPRREEIIDFGRLKIEKAMRVKPGMEGIFTCREDPYFDRGKRDTKGYYVDPDTPFKVIASEKVSEDEIWIQVEVTKTTDAKKWAGQEPVTKGMQFWIEITSNPRFAFTLDIPGVTDIVSQSVKSKNSGFGLAKQSSIDLALADSPDLKKWSDKRSPIVQAVVRALAAVFLVPAYEAQEITEAMTDPAARKRFLAGHPDNPNWSKARNRFAAFMRSAGLSFILATMRLTLRFNAGAVDKANRYSHTLYNGFAVLFGMALVKNNDSERIWSAVDDLQKVMAIPEAGFSLGEANAEALRQILKNHTEYIDEIERDAKRIRNAATVDEKVDSIMHLVTKLSKITALRPLFPVSIDKEKAEEWIDAHSPADRKLTRTLVDNIEYISQEEFEAELEKTIKDFNEKMRGKPYILFIPALKGNRSEDWVFRMAQEKGLYAPARIIRFYGVSDRYYQTYFFYDDKPNEVYSDVNAMFPQSGIRDIAFIDDAIYSANQMFARMDDNIRFRFEKGLDVHFIVPFLSVAAEGRLTGEIKNKYHWINNTYLYQHRTLKILKDILEGVNLQYPSELAKEIGDNLRLSLVFFQHKVPDDTSIPWAVIKGSVYEDAGKGVERRTFMPLYKPPYDKEYLNDVRAKLHEYFKEKFAGNQAGVLLHEPEPAKSEYSLQNEGGFGFGLALNSSVKTAIARRPRLQRLYDMRGPIGKAAIEMIAAVFLAADEEDEEVTLARTDKTVREKFLADHFDPSRSDLFNHIAAIVRSGELEAVHFTMELASPFNERIQKAANNLTHKIFNLFTVPLGIAVGLFTGGLADFSVLKERRRAEQAGTMGTDRRSLDRLDTRIARGGLALSILLTFFGFRLTKGKTAGDESVPVIDNRRAGMFRKKVLDEVVKELETLELDFDTVLSYGIWHLLIDGVDLQTAVGIAGKALPMDPDEVMKIFLGERERLTDTAVLEQVRRKQVMISQKFADGSIPLSSPERERDEENVRKSGQIEEVVKGVLWDSPDAYYPLVNADNTPIDLKRRQTENAAAPLMESAGTFGSDLDMLFPGMTGKIVYDVFLYPGYGAGTGQKPDLLAAEGSTYRILDVRKTSETEAWVHLRIIGNKDDRNLAAGEGVERWAKITAGPDALMPFGNPSFPAGIYTKEFKGRKIVVVAGQPTAPGSTEVFEAFLNSDPRFRAGDGVLSINNVSGEESWDDKIVSLQEIAKEHGIPVMYAPVVNQNSQQVIAETAERWGLSRDKLYANIMIQYGAERGERNLRDTVLHFAAKFPLLGIDELAAIAVNKAKEHEGRSAQEHIAEFTDILRKMTWVYNELSEPVFGKIEKQAEKKHIVFYTDASHIPALFKIYSSEGWEEIDAAALMNNAQSPLNNSEINAVLTENILHHSYPGMRGRLVHATALYASPETEKVEYLVLPGNAFEIVSVKKASDKTTVWLQLKFLDKSSGIEAGVEPWLKITSASALFFEPLILPENEKLVTQWRNAGKSDEYIAARIALKERLHAFLRPLHFYRAHNDPGPVRAAGVFLMSVFSYVPAVAVALVTVPVFVPTLGAAGIAAGAASGIAAGLFGGGLFQYRWDLPVLKARRRGEQTGNVRRSVHVGSRNRGAGIELVFAVLMAFFGDLTEEREVSGSGDVPVIGNQIAQMFAREVLEEIGKEENLDFDTILAYALLNYVNDKNEFNRVVGIIAKVLGKETFEITDIFLEQEQSGHLEDFAMPEKIHKRQLEMVNGSMPESGLSGHTPHSEKQSPAIALVSAMSPGMSGRFIDYALLYKANHIVDSSARRGDAYEILEIKWNRSAGEAWVLVKLRGVSGKDIERWVKITSDPKEVMPLGTPRFPAGIRTGTFGEEEIAVIPESPDEEEDPNSSSDKMAEVMMMYPGMTGKFILDDMLSVATSEAPVLEFAVSAGSTYKIVSVHRDRENDRKIWVKVEILQNTYRRENAAWAGGQFLVQVTADSPLTLGQPHFDAGVWKKNITVGTKVKTIVAIAVKDPSAASVGDETMRLAPVVHPWDEEIVKEVLKQQHMEYTGEDLDDLCDAVKQYFEGNAGALPEQLVPLAKAVMRISREESLPGIAAMVNEAAAREEQEIKFHLSPADVPLLYNLYGPYDWEIAGESDVSAEKIAGLRRSGLLLPANEPQVKEWLRQERSDGWIAARIAKRELLYAFFDPVGFFLDHGVVMRGRLKGMFLVSAASYIPVVLGLAFVPPVMPVAGLAGILFSIAVSIETGLVSGGIAHFAWNLSILREHERIDALLPEIETAVAAPAAGVSFGELNAQALRQALRKDGSRIGKFEKAVRQVKSATDKKKRIGKIIELLHKVREIIPLRPLVDLPLDKDKAGEWVAAHGEPYRALAQFLVDNITYIDQKQFEDALAETIGDFNEQYGDKRYILLLPGWKGERSEHWVHRLAQEKGLKLPEHTIVLDRPEVTSYEDVREFQSETLRTIATSGIQDIVLIDDAAYTGTSIRRFLNGVLLNMPVDEKVNLHLIIPFMTKAAEDKFTADSLTKAYGGRVEKAVIYKHSTMKSLSDLFSSELKLKFRLQALGVLPGGLVQDKWITLHYFQHNRPGHNATLRSVTEGAIYRNGRITNEWIPFIPEIVSPYDENYLEYIEKLLLAADDEKTMPANTVHSEEMKRYGNDTGETATESIRVAHIAGEREFGENSKRLGQEKGIEHVWYTGLPANYPGGKMPLMTVSLSGGEADVYESKDGKNTVFYIDMSGERDVDAALGAAAAQVSRYLGGTDNLPGERKNFGLDMVVIHAGDVAKVREAFSGEGINKPGFISFSVLAGKGPSLNAAVRRRHIRHKATNADLRAGKILKIDDAIADKGSGREKFLRSLRILEAAGAGELLVDWNKGVKEEDLVELVKLKRGNVLVHAAFEANEDTELNEILVLYDKFGFASVGLDLEKNNVSVAKAEKLLKGLAGRSLLYVKAPVGVSVPSVKTIETLTSQIVENKQFNTNAVLDVRLPKDADPVAITRYLGNLPPEATTIFHIEDIEDLVTADRDAIDDKVLVSFLNILVNLAGQTIDTPQKAKQRAYNWPVQNLPVLSGEQIKVLLEGKLEGSGLGPDSAIREQAEELTQLDVQAVFLNVIAKQMLIRNLVLEQKDRALADAYTKGEYTILDSYMKELLGNAAAKKALMSKEESDNDAAAATGIEKKRQGTYNALLAELSPALAEEHPQPGTVTAVISIGLRNFAADFNLRQSLKKQGELDAGAVKRLLSAA